MAQRGWEVNLERCTGCHGCTIACKAKFRDAEEPKILRRFPVGVPQPVTADYFVPLACNHCAEPSCVPACPRGALYKDGDTGIVLQDESRCIGCRRCEWACPYGAIEFNSDTGKITKCDMCIDRQLNGEVPWCVQTCACGVLHVEDFTAEPGAGAPAGFANPDLTKPSVRFTGPGPV